MVVLGALLGLAGLGFLAASSLVLALFGTDNRAVLPVGTVAADGRAVAVNDFQIEAPAPLPLEQDWFDLEIEVKSQKPLFVGVAEKQDVIRYLQGVPFELVTGLDTSTGSIEGRSLPGSARPEPPADQEFFTDTGSGRDVVVAWPVSPDQTTLLIMNQNLSRSVDAELDVVVTVPWARNAIIGTAVIGLLLVALALVLLVKASRSEQRV